MTCDVCGRDHSKDAFSCGVALVMGYFDAFPSDTKPIQKKRKWWNFN